MNQTTEKRRAFIINIFYFALILAIFYLVFKTFFGILFPFIAAFFIAAAVNRPVSYFERKTPLKRGIISVVLILLILCAVLGLFSLLGIRVIDKLRGFYQAIILKTQNLNEFFDTIKGSILGIISFLPQKLYDSVAQSVTAFFDNLAQNGLESFSISDLGVNWSSLLSKGGGMIKDTVVQIPSVLIATVITIVASIFMSTDYQNIKRFVLSQFSEKNKLRVKKARGVALTTFKSMFRAYFFICLITATELFIGLEILKLFKVFDSDYVIIISVIIAIIDIIPVLGTGTVLIPWAIYSFITGNISMGIGLIVIYAVITVIRQVMEPKFVAGQAGLSPVVTIAAMYIGTKTIGVLGFLIVPFLVILVKKFNDEGIIHLFNSSIPEQQQTENENGQADSENKEEAADTVLENKTAES